MYRSLALIFAFTATACSYSQEKFEEDLVEAACTFYDGCEESVFADRTACEEAYAPSDTDDPPEEADCRFFADKAEKCITELETAECESTGTNYPAICVEVVICFGDDSTSESE